MRGLLGAVVVSATFGVASAFAADLPVKAPALAPVAAPVGWTGCYVGAGVGYGMWNQDTTLTGILIGPGTTVVSQQTTDGGRGWLGRVGVGCDYQFASRWVIGAFGDFDWMSLKGTNLPNEIVVGGPPNGVTSPLAYNVKQTSAWYAGARLGYLPYPDLLTFVSGGWTGTRFSNGIEFQTLNGLTPGLTYPGSYTVSGWFLGSGYEYRLPWWQGLTWKTEYRFAQYQSANLVETVIATGAPTGNSQSNRSSVQTITTSLVWHFNFGGPVVARY